MIHGPTFVELTVADWPAAVRWYVDVLGLEMIQGDETHRFALLGGGTGRLALKEGQPRPGTTRLVFEVDDLAATMDQLTRLGVAFDGPVKDSPEGYRRVLLHDADGHRLALFEWITGRA